MRKCLKGEIHSFIGRGKDKFECTFCDVVFTRQELIRYSKQLDCNLHNYIRYEVGDPDKPMIHYTCSLCAKLITEGAYLKLGGQNEKCSLSEEMVQE